MFVTDFFISYNRADKFWAEWIAWQLEEASYSTIIQSWDFRPGSNFVEEMQRATVEAERTIAVVSPDYLSSEFARSEWNTAFAHDPLGNEGKLVPVKVKDCELDGLKKAIIYIDLTRLSEEAAKEELIKGVNRSDRVKPKKEPPFPGTLAKTSIKKPKFPGSLHEKVVQRRTSRYFKKAFLENPKPYKKFVSGPEPIRILHLSDLHIEKESDITLILQPLIDDIKNKSYGIGIERIDYLVVSGDLINSAGAVKFKNALDFIYKLLKAFNLENNKCIIVPGNHDLHWDKEGLYNGRFKRSVDLGKLDSGSYSVQGDTIQIKDEDKYSTRFEEFSVDLYCQLFGKPYSSDQKFQFHDVIFHDTRIQFLALNSCYEIDCYNPKNSGISSEALAEALMKANSEVEKAKESGISKNAPIFRIAVWHHPVSGIDAIRNTDFLERLRTNDFKICLHGHSHKDQHELFYYLYQNKIYIIGAGTSGIGVRDRPACSPYEYNLLEIDRDFSKVKVHTRCKRTENGAWEGWALWPGQGLTKFEKRTFYEIEFDGLTYAE
jgi:predicted phosphodiesterase